MQSSSDSVSTAAVEINKELTVIQQITNEMRTIKARNASLAHDNANLRESLEMYTTVESSVASVDESVIPNKEELHCDALSCVNEWIESKASLGIMRKKVCDAVIDAIMSEDLEDGNVKRINIERVRLWYRENVFTPSKVLEAMDLAGGQLSYTGLEVLRSVESNGKRYHRGILPSTSTVQRIAKKVEAMAAEIAPVRFYSTAHGEAFEFDSKTLLNTLLKAYKLDKVAEVRPVSMSTAMDGFKFSRTKRALASGIKFHDRAAICPRTGAMLGLPAEPGSDDIPSKIQSREHAFPFGITTGPETSETQLNHDVFFKLVGSCALSKEEMDLPPTEQALLENPHFPGKKKFLVAANADLVGHQKATGKGGACKVKKLFCTYCPTLSSNAHVPNDEQCTRFCAEIHPMATCVASQMWMPLPAALLMYPSFHPDGP
jgi:hypothetical protein